MVVFCGNFECTSKGYVVRETSLASLEREGVAFQGLLCLPLKSGGFLWHFCGTFGCTSKGYVERETSLALLERERESLFRACYARLSKVVVFCGTFECTSKGYVVREISLASLEREGVTFQGSLCLPLKSGGFLWHF